MLRGVGTPVCHIGANWGLVGRPWVAGGQTTVEEVVMKPLGNGAFQLRELVVSTGSLGRVKQGPLVLSRLLYSDNEGYESP